MIFKQFRLGTSLRGFVKSVTNPHHFYVETYQNQQTLVDFEQQLHAFYSSPEAESLVIQTPCRGSIYVVQWKGRWHRVIIEDVILPTMFFGFFYDTGLREVFSPLKMCRLAQKFLRIEPRSILCQLSDVVPDHSSEPTLWTKESCHFFCSMVNQKNVKITVDDQEFFFGPSKETKLYVNMHVEGQIISVNSLMTERLHGMPTPCEEPSPSTSAGVGGAHKPPSPSASRDDQKGRSLRGMATLLEGPSHATTSVRGAHEPPQDSRNVQKGRVNQTKPPKVSAGSVGELSRSRVPSKPGRELPGSRFFKIEYKNPQEGNVFHGLVGWAVSPSEFFFHNERNHPDRFSSFNHQMQRELEGTMAANPKLDLRLDQPLAAFFNQEWRRAILLQVERRQATIYLVDSGRRVSVPKHSLRPLDDKFVEFPAQAIPCRLHGVRPNPPQGEWNRAACRFFQQTVVNSRVTMFVGQTPDASPLPEFHLSVFLYVGREVESVNWKMANHGHGLMWKSHVRLPDKEDPDAPKAETQLDFLQDVPIGGGFDQMLVRFDRSEVSQPLFNSPNCRMSTGYDLPSPFQYYKGNPFIRTVGKMPDNGDSIIEVELLNFVSTEAIYFRPVLFRADFTEIRARLERAYSNRKPKKTGAAAPGQWYAAHVGGVWIRAVVSVVHDDHCMIQCADTGQFHAVNDQHIWPLVEPFHSIPALVIKCALALPERNETLDAAAQDCLRDAVKIFIGYNINKPQIFPAAVNVDVICGRIDPSPSPIYSDKILINLRESLLRNVS